EKILDPQTTVPLIFSALAFLTVIALALPWLQPDLFATRLKVIRQRRAELNQQRRAALEARPGRRRAPLSVGMMRAVLERLHIPDLAERPALRRKLIQAGWRGQAPLVTFMFLRIALPLLGGGLALAFLFGWAKVEVTPFLIAAFGFGSVLVGYYLPAV